MAKHNISKICTWYIHLHFWSAQTCQCCSK